MAGYKQKGPKDPYADLSGVFKDAIRQMSPEEIRVRIAEFALDHNLLMKSKKADKDLSERKLAVEKLAEKYKDGSQMHSLKFKLLPKDQPTDATKAEIADIALAEVDLQNEKDDDEELGAAKEKLSMASEVYTKSAKTTRLKIKFCKSVLEDKGKA